MPSARCLLDPCDCLCCLRMPCSQTMQLVVFEDLLRFGQQQLFTTIKEVVTVLHASVTLQNCCHSCRLVQSSGMEEAMAMFEPVCSLSNNKLMTSGSHVCFSLQVHSLPASGCTAPQMGQLHAACAALNSISPLVAIQPILTLDLQHHNRCCSSCSAATMQLPRRYHADALEQRYGSAS